jgi:hypothetical protein
MGFKKPDLMSAKGTIQTVLAEIHSPYNDGWTSSSCKYDLYLLKCWLEDQYNTLPIFVGEEKWEQERLLEVLKK